MGAGIRQSARMRHVHSRCSRNVRPECPNAAARRKRPRQATTTGSATTTLLLMANNEAARSVRVSRANRPRPCAREPCVVVTHRGQFIAKAVDTFAQDGCNGGRKSAPVLV